MRNDLNSTHETINIRRYPIDGIAHRVKRDVLDDVVPTCAFLNNRVIDEQGTVIIQAKALQIQQEYRMMYHSGYINLVQINHTHEIFTINLKQRWRPQKIMFALSQ